MDVAADFQAVNAVREQFVGAFNSNAATALAALYTDDAVLMLPNQEAIEGKPAIQSALEDSFEQNAAEIAHTPLETHVAGDSAYERGNITETITPKAGKPIERSVKYLVILKRQPDGSWKVHLDMGNSNSKEPT